MPNVQELSPKEHSIQATEQLFNLITANPKKNFYQDAAYYLDYCFGPEDIIIKIVDYPCELYCIYHFQNNTIEFDLQTKQLTNDRSSHPDFNAKKFKELSINFFDKLNLPIDRILSRYPSRSDNYAQFMAIYNSLIDNRLEAVNNTCSAKTNKLFRFVPRDVNQIEITKYEIQNISFARNN